MKQRLVGAVVLVALGVIFIPMILTGGKDEIPYFGSNIPKQPDEIKELKSLRFSKQAEPEQPAPLIRIPVDEHTQTDVQAKAPAADNKAAVAAPDEVTELVEKATESSEPPKAWVVQVGSFSQRDNALALRDKLRAKNYPSFVELLKGKNGEIYRVRVGPEATHGDAEKTMQKIRKQFKLNGVVMGHATGTN